MSEKNVSTLFYNMLKKKPPTSDDPWWAAPYMINIASARGEYETYTAIIIKSFVYCSSSMA